MTIKIFKNGSFRKGKVNYLKSGDTFEGTMNKESKKEGYGIYRWKSGGVYIGNWQNDIKIGYGTLKTSIGMIYIGNYKDKRNGEGVFHWPNGDTFEGVWKDGKRCGKGIFTEFATQKKYEQFWNQDIEKYGSQIPERFPNKE